MEFTYVNLLLVLLLAWGGGAIASRVGYPAILGELLVGIVFGPAMLGFLEPELGLKVLADVGVFLLMLYIGMEIDLRQIRESSGAAVFAALGGFLVPGALAYTVVTTAGFDPAAALVVAVAAGVTSLAVGPRILVDLKLMNTRIASVLTTGALISDTLALLLFAGVDSTVAQGTFEPLAMVLLVGKALLFFGVVSFIGLRIFPTLAAGMERLGLTGRTAHFTMLLIVAALYAELAELAGLHAILGAFMAGLFLGESVMGPRQSKELEHLVHDLSIGFLAPLFFVQTGFHFQPEVFGAAPWLMVGIVAAATFGKILGFVLCYLPSRNGWREGLTIAAGMNGRGALDIVVAGIALDAGLITSDLFSILVVLALFSAFTVPVFLRVLVAWLRRRDELVEEERRQGVLIVGAGHLAQELALRLQAHERVTLIDSNVEHCDAAKALGLDVVYGNALTEEALREARAQETRLMIALTPNPQINILVSQMGRETYLIPEITMFLHRREQQRAGELLGRMGVGSFDFGATEPEDWDRWLAHRRVVPKTVDLTEATTPEQLIAAMDAQHPFLPLVVHRADRPRFLFGEPELVPGDTLDGISVPTDETPDEDDFDRLVRQAPILDLEGLTTQEDGFAQVAGALAERLQQPPDRLAAQLNERQRLDTTVLTQGLAVPHIRIEGEGRFELAIVRARDGVLMEPDERKVFALFALIGTRDRRTLHLRVLSAIAQIVQDPQFESLWLGARDDRELRQLLLQSRRRRFDETFA